LGRLLSKQIRDVRALIDAHGKPEREVYFDLENSGIIFEEALNELVRAYKEHGYGHPSITHKLGWAAFEIILNAEANLIALVNAEDGEIVFTHGGTEANNLAIMGLAKANRDRRKIIISSTEHPSVKFPAERLQEHGFKIVEIPVDEQGFISLEKLSEEVDGKTLMVSIAAVNHEIGTIQDLKAATEIVKDRDPNVVVHTDACDALGKIPLDLKKLEVDMVSFSGHKIYAPKGVGALYVRDGIKLEPIIYGQLSSQRLWPGVENVPSIAGFSKALELFRKNFDNYRAKMRMLRDMLIDGVLENVEDSVLNGPRGDRRSVDNVNISFLRCEGEALTVELSLRGVYVSSGSACTSRALEPSHVLLGIRRPYEVAHGSVLMKVSPMHDKEDVEYALRQLSEAVKRIRSISPKEVM